MNPFYIYALKDPRTNPVRPFYIGKGTGSRAWDHTLKPDSTSKGRRISEIANQGAEVIVSILADDLTEFQALRLEAELIAAFGTEATGGMLTNSVIPSTLQAKSKLTVLVPDGAVERAQLGLLLLKEAVMELARANADGISNADASKTLGLQSDYGGGSKDYLAWSVLGILMKEGKISRTPSRKHVVTVR